ncbi:unnamed protein product [Rotaria sordida]|uniref:Uncharacterized protein n=1 Tax=Rotaria sordida TaxID=392033 RepID=A0A814W985_9BILA|nr:unnamed protein product [Rotaria sordida]CAF3964113.1 unnamed protein product [Rotaria sordida]
MFCLSKILTSNVRPLFMLKNISSMATLASPTATYSGIVSDTLTQIYNKYHFKNDIKLAKTTCQAARFLDEYLSHYEERKHNENTVFLCHIYHMFVEFLFNTLEIVENDRYTTNTHDLENIHYNIFTNTHFNKSCGSEKGPHGETSLFMISYIAQKIKYDYNITFEEFKRHACHVDAYIEKMMTYLRDKHLVNEQRDGDKAHINEIPSII